MITYINSKNAQKYHILFDKAAQLLKQEQPSDLTSTLTNYGLSWDDFSISSLNEYFAYLQDLINAASTEDEKRFFVRLPLDEDIFEINADTRSIAVPNSFANNGVGVQGDEMAEVVYFTIDRYFDSTDLANDDINIAIQWEARGADGETIQGFSKNFGKDIETVPGKIIFGWPISSEFTKASGSIKFAVRFYSISSEDVFTYSFTTLPATVKINASLDYDVIQKTVPEIDHGQVITNRVRNSGIYNPSMPTPAAPVISTPLYVMAPEGNETYKIVDLPADDSGIKLAIGAQPGDVGVVGYNWKHFNYLDGEYSSTPATVDANDIAVEYVEMTDTLNSEYEYYSKSALDENAYSLFDLDNLVGLTYEEDEGYLKNDETFVKLYRKVNTAQVFETGIYTADVYARALVNTTTTTMDVADGIKVPGPLKPVINLPAATAYVSVNDADKSVHVIADAGAAATLSAQAISGEEDIQENYSSEEAIARVGVNPVVDLTYQWQKQVGANWNDIAEATGTSLELSGLEDEDLDDNYRVVVTSTRNTVSTTEVSGNYRVTQAPAEPEVRIRELDTSGSTPQLRWVVNDYTSANNKKIIRKQPNADATLLVGVNPNIKSDNLSYLWMKIENANVDNLQIDLADEDSITSQAINEVVEGITNIFGNPIGDKDTLVQELSQFGSVFTDSDTSFAEHYEAEYAASASGVYYCVVINELNEHINANASPFFIVSEL